MRNYSFFEVYGNDAEVRSTYIPIVSFATQEAKNSAESYILSEAAIFFRDILKNSELVQLVPYLETVTFKDFNQVEIDYFYNTLFSDLGERGSNGKLVRKLKWSVSFDEEMTPIQVAYLSPSYSENPEDAKPSCLDSRSGRPHFLYRPHKPHLNYRKYGYISANGKPIFYYLYFTLQEILDALK
jgi:hypothetical protein